MSRGRLLGAAVFAVVIQAGCATPPTACDVVIWGSGTAQLEEGASIPPGTNPIVGSADIDLEQSQFGIGQTGEPTLTLVLRPDAAERMAEHTRNNVGNYMPIAINGTVAVTPVINAPVEDGVIVIESNSTPPSPFDAFRSCVGGS